MSRPFKGAEKTMATLSEGHFFVISVEISLSLPFEHVRNIISPKFRSVDFLAKRAEQEILLNCQI